MQNLLLQTSHLKGVDLHFPSWILHMWQSPLSVQSQAQIRELLHLYLCRSLHSRLIHYPDVNNHFVNVNVASRLLEVKKRSKLQYLPK